MLAEAVDGLLPSLNKHRILNGYAAQSRDGIRFMDLGLAHIRYRQAGHGAKTLVFVTDPPIVIEHYDALIDTLKHDFSLLVVEAPGFGFSIPSMRLDYRFQTMVTLFEHFLSQLALGPVTFLAPCAVGYVAIGLAHKRPDLIEKLVLMQVPSWEEILKWKHRRDPKGLLGIPVISQILLQNLKRTRTHKWFEMALGNQDLLTRFNNIAQEGYAHGAAFNLASAFQQLLVNTSPLPQQIVQPSLFIWGESDKSHCTTCKQSSLQMIPGAQLANIPAAGHFPELETPDEFASLVTRFIEG